MRVFRVGPSRELNRLVALCELDIEPGNDGVNEVISAGVECEGCDEGKVLGLDGVQVEGDNSGGVSDYGLHVDDVNEGLGHGGGFEGSVVEAPNIVPDCLICQIRRHLTVNLRDLQPIFSSL